MFIYEYIYIDRCIHTYTYVYIYLHVYMYICVYSPFQPIRFVLLCVCICAHVCVCGYAHVCARMYTCVCGYLCQFNVG